MRRMEDERMPCLAPSARAQRNKTERSTPATWSGWPATLAQVLPCVVGAWLRRVHYVAAVAKGYP
jgi:hypothetical protein